MYLFLFGMPPMAYDKKPDVASHCISMIVSFCLL
jgi:hypothetical protein